MKIYEKNKNKNLLKKKKRFRFTFSDLHYGKVLRKTHLIKS